MSPLFGRPREFKYKMREELVNHVARGATVAEAAQIIGVSVRTVQREAKHNQQFHHDLELAKHSAPSDLEEQMKQAARTHWRAAAWLLERQEPERFGKRPANSCSPAVLQDACDFLIEKALEATPPEHREAVYRHACAAADQMFEVIMPDRTVERRCLATALAKQTTPLSCELESKLRKNPDYVRTQREKELTQRPWRQVERLLGAKRKVERVKDPADGSPPPQWQPANGKRQDSSDMDAAWRYPTPEEEDAYADRLAEKAGDLQEDAAQRERNRELLLAAMERNRQAKQNTKKPSANGKPADATPADVMPAGAAAPVPPPVFGPEFSDCVPEETCKPGNDGSPANDGPCCAPLEGTCAGLMSPKTWFRDKSGATKVDATQQQSGSTKTESPGDEPPTILPPDFDLEARVRERRAEILARIEERRKAG